MSRTFSTARQNLTKWLGYSKDLLPTTWKGAVERYEVGGAVKVSFPRICSSTGLLLKGTIESWGD